jgi:hypothetical protein
MMISSVRSVSTTVRPANNTHKTVLPSTSSSAQLTHGKTTVSFMGKKKGPL